MLTLRQFTKRFNDHLILEIEEQQFAHGIHWIKGENGSGKTTLFKSISGVIPFEGQVIFSDGLDSRRQPVLFRAQINYSEAEPSYPGFLTAKDLIRFMGKIKNESVTQQDEYVRRFGVDAFFEKPCETYSSGMMKKLSLVIAFFGNPKLIILDEPLITLDEQARSILYTLIKERLSKGNTIFLMSSHQNIAATDLDIVQTLAIQNKKLVAL